MTPPKGVQPYTDARIERTERALLVRQLIEQAKEVWKIAVSKDTFPQSVFPSELYPNISSINVRGVLLEKLNDTPYVWVVVEMYNYITAIKELVAVTLVEYPEQPDSKQTIFGEFSSAYDLLTIKTPEGDFDYQLDKNNSRFLITEGAEIDKPNNIVILKEGILSTLDSWNH